MNVKRWVMLATTLAVVAATVVGALSAGAVTGWMPFGTGSAKGGGIGGFPFLAVDSTTNANPIAVRVEVVKVPASAPSLTAQVSWSLSCVKGYNYAYKSGSGRVTLPWVRMPTLPIAHPDYCSLDVTAYHSGATRIRINEFAQYG